MPKLTAIVAAANPLTYLVDALRGLMIRDRVSVHSLGFDLGVLIGIFAALLLIAARAYPRLGA